MNIQKRQMLGEYYLAGLICSGDWAKVFAGDYPRPGDISEMARMEEKWLIRQERTLPHEWPGYAV